MIFTHCFQDDLETLGLCPDADYDEAALKKAYRRKAMQTHPDKHSPEEKEEWEEKFKSVSTAHERLKKELENTTNLRCPICGGNHDMMDCDQLFQEHTRRPATPPPRPRPRVNVCEYCGKVGHTADRCHKRMRDQAKPTCTYCGIKGHTAENCFKRMKAEETCGQCRAAGRPYKHRVENCHFIHPCHICGKTGHSASSCRWKGVPKCTHCGEFGHRVQKCFKLHPHLIPTCTRCGVKGHYSYNCHVRDVPYCPRVY